MVMVFYLCTVKGPVISGREAWEWPGGGGAGERTADINCFEADDAPMIRSTLLF